MHLSSANTLENPQVGDPEFINALAQPPMVRRKATRFASCTLSRRALSARVAVAYGVMSVKGRMWMCEGGLAFGCPGAMASMCTSLFATVDD